MQVLNELLPAYFLISGFICFVVILFWIGVATLWHKTNVNEIETDILCDLGAVAAVATGYKRKLRALAKVRRFRIFMEVIKKREKTKNKRVGWVRICVL